MVIDLKNEKLNQGESIDKNKPGFFRSTVAHQGGILMVIVAGLILAAGYFLLLAPMVNDMIILEDSLAATESEIDSLEIQIKKFENLRREYEEIDQSKISKIESLVTVTPDLPNLYIQIQELARKNNLVADSINAEPQGLGEDDDGNLGVVDVSIKISESDYSSMKKFVSDLENNLRILDIETLSFPEKIDTFNVELSAYYIK